MIHTIKLSGYKASPGFLRFGTVDSYGVEQMQFVLGDDWKDLAITATFTNPQEKSTMVHVPVDTLLIDVPPEATAGESGAGQIAVVGYADIAEVEALAQAYYDALDAETVQDGNATNEQIQNPLYEEEDK